jgi:hypothetical protein
MDYDWKLCEKKKKVMLDEKMGKVAKGERKRKRKRKEKNRQEKCSFVFLRFYVDGA